MYVPGLIGLLILSLVTMSILFWAVPWYHAKLFKQQLKDAEIQLKRDKQRANFRRRFK